MHIRRRFGALFRLYNNVDTLRGCQLSRHIARMLTHRVIAIVAIVLIVYRWLCFGYRLFLYDICCSALI